MAYLLVIQLLFPDSCDDIKYKTISMLNYGYISMSFNKRNTDVQLPDKLRRYGIKYIHIDEYGFYDFTPFSTKTIEFETTGKRWKDYKLADMPYVEGLARHHTPDGKHIQYVIEEVHDYYKHSGGLYTYHMKLKKRSHAYRYFR